MVFQILGFLKDVEIEVSNGVNLKVNTNAIDLFQGLDKFFSDITKAGEEVDFNAAPEELDTQMNKVLEKRIDIGARTTVLN